MKLWIIELITNKILPKKKYILKLSSKNFSSLIDEFSINEINKKNADIENADGNKNKPVLKKMLIKFSFEIESFFRYKFSNYYFI